jgi:hypothetical protein
VDAVTGSFQAELAVPADARLQSYSLQLSVPRTTAEGGAPMQSGRVKSAVGRGLASQAWQGGATAGGPFMVSSPSTMTVATLSFTVADPRPPTAELQVGERDGRVLCLACKAF